MRWASVVAGVALLALSAGAAAQASGTVVWLNSSEAHSGAVTDRAALHAVLQGLGALPEGPGPVVVSVHSLDSMFPWQAPLTRAAQAVISGAAREAGGEAAVLVAAPWGRPSERAARGSRFPTTPEELEAMGYGWLLAPEGFRLAWDHESLVAELTAARSLVRGDETLGGVHLYLCVDGETVRGWARSWAYRGHRNPSDASLGRFARDCLQDALGMPDEYVVPEDVRAALGVEGWFAVRLPNAFDQPVPVASAIESALELLALASVPIPLHLVAVEAVAEGFSRYVPAAEHAAALAELGVSVDAAFQAGFPEWVRDFATHNTTMLVMFDDAGRAVAHFGASPSNPLGQETLVEALMRWGML